MKIKEGSMVIYKRTGTIGRIIEFRSIDGRLWAKLDTTNLLYDVNFLEEIQPQQSFNEQKIEINKSSNEQKIEINKKALEERKEEDIDSCADVCGAG